MHALPRGEDSSSAANIYHVIYLSSAVLRFSSEEIAGLLAQSREYNALHGITGLLLYRDGNFLQVIEGERASVKKLYSKILRDSRHHAITQLFAEDLPRREFAEWTMAFRDLSAAKIPDGFNELLNSSWSDMNLTGFPVKVRAFMKMFSQE